MQISSTSALHILRVAGNGGADPSEFEAPVVHAATLRSCNKYFFPDTRPDATGAWQAHFNERFARELVPTALI